MRAMYYHIYIARLITFLHASQSNDVITTRALRICLGVEHRATRKRRSRSFRPLLSSSSVVETRTHSRPAAYGIDPENRTSGGNSFRHDALLEGSRPRLSRIRRDCEKCPVYSRPLAELSVCAIFLFASLAQNINVRVVCTETEYSVKIDGTVFNCKIEWFETTCGIARFILQLILIVCPF